MDVAQLQAALRLDFRPTDLGDTPEQFAERLTYLTKAALARTGATPAQREAGVRYHLLSAQVRQLVRQAESLKAASGASITQGLATRLAELRAQMAEQLALSGLNPPADPSGRVRGSVNVPLEVVY